LFILAVSVEKRALSQDTHRPHTPNLAPTVETLNLPKTREEKSLCVIVVVVDFSYILSA